MVIVVVVVAAVAVAVAVAAAHLSEPDLKQACKRPELKLCLPTRHMRRHRCDCRASEAILVPGGRRRLGDSYLPSGIS